MCKAIKQVKHQSVEFIDGKVESFDAIILATGYRSNVMSWLKVDINRSLASFNLITVKLLISIRVFGHP